MLRSDFLTVLLKSVLSTYIYSSKLSSNTYESKILCVQYKVNDSLKYSSFIKPVPLE